MSPTFSVSDFVASVNQTFDYAYTSVTIIGELANFKISKGKWVYADIKDEAASVRLFGTVYMLPGPLEDGMMVRVQGTPRLHAQFGFSLNVQSIQPVGEGAIKKAASLLEAKLKAQGLFDTSRKRALPYPPSKIGLIASKESAAYADFMKIIDQRWSGLTIVHADVQVQGEAAPQGLVQALQQLNEQPGIEVIVMTRGGGSAEDLAAFSNEQVVQAVAASRVPTMVAVGHEIDTSLAELAADLRASTPSNAAELLVPDKRVTAEQLATTRIALKNGMAQLLDTLRTEGRALLEQVSSSVLDLIVRSQRELLVIEKVVQSYNPETVLQRGYALIRKGANQVTSVEQLNLNDAVRLQFMSGTAEARITKLPLHPKKRV